MPIDMIVKIDTLSQQKRETFSRTVEDLLSRGLKSYYEAVEEETFKKDLDAIRELEGIKSAVMGNGQR